MGYRLKEVSLMNNRKGLKGLLVLTFVLSMTSCGPIIDYSKFEGTEEDPVQISTSVHRGFIGSEPYTSCSYYYFDSSVANPKIHYGNVYPDQDLDITVYNDPSFYYGEVYRETSMTSDLAYLYSSDFTGTRLYVKISNYSSTKDAEFDIYYE
jgi:hypothetical protein